MYQTKITTGRNTVRNVFAIRKRDDFVDVKA